MKPNDLSNIFKNVNHKPCNSPGYDFAFDVTENNKFIGELFYSTQFKEWNFIKDNYPANRRSFAVSFPIETPELLVELFKTIDVNLIFNL